MRLTVARSFTRNGRNIHSQGLPADIRVAIGNAVRGTPEDLQLQQAITVVSSLMRAGALAGAR